ncbi:hypothetical protein [Hungatella hathewayi]|uniref:hypothetical protein n=1 Tax=Hungatella hathewayi TaxID=154046 RepID=UPI0011DD32F6|nr:hypothetical protein [Hungatella hathewayi]
MTRKMIYTAIGRFVRRTNGCGRSCPAVLLGGQEYLMDMQEMVLWTSLNWRIAKKEEIGAIYEKTASGACFSSDRSWEACVDRLLTRGLLIAGSGETEYDALYDLLGSLSIIPADGSFGLRCLTFLKLTLLDRVPFSAARKLFQKDCRTADETQVMKLARQALLSTAEIIKCVEKDISHLPNERVLLDALYNDNDTTSDNIASMMKSNASTKPVILAVANLYLRQQIVFERV